MFVISTFLGFVTRNALSEDVHRTDFMVLVRRCFDEDLHQALKISSRAGAEMLVQKLGQRIPLDALLPEILPVERALGVHPA